MATSPLEYHLEELKLAQDAADSRRILPEIPPEARSVLDVGCGAGQTLVACHREGCRAVGVEFDFAALQLGRQLQVPAHLAQASGERLPFAAASFDFLFSRVALPYMNIPVALAEMARVMQPGGRIWLTLHPLAMLSWSYALRDPRRMVFEIYRLCNTAALHFTGKQFHYPLRRSRMESYQTGQGIRRALKRAGFEEIEIRQATHFVVKARRAGIPGRGTC